MMAQKPGWSPSLCGARALNQLIAKSGTLFSFDALHRQRRSSRCQATPSFAHQQENKGVKSGLASFPAESSPPAAESACFPGTILSDVEYWKPQRCSGLSPALRRFPGRSFCRGPVGEMRNQHTRNVLPAAHALIDLALIAVQRSPYAVWVRIFRRQASDFPTPRRAIFRYTAASTPGRLDTRFREVRARCRPR